MNARAHLSSQLSDTKGQLSTAQANIERLNGDVASAKSDASAAQSELDKTQSALRTCQTAVNLSQRGFKQIGRLLTAENRGDLITAYYALKSVERLAGPTDSASNACVATAGGAL
jgi:peptidoglycan hydrolase CwlO-like protein